METWFGLLSSGSPVSNIRIHGQVDCAAANFTEQDFKPGTFPSTPCLAQDQRQRFILFAVGQQPRQSTCLRQLASWESAQSSPRDHFERSRRSLFASPGTNLLLPFFNRSNLLQRSQIPPHHLHLHQPIPPLNP